MFTNVILYYKYVKDEISQLKKNYVLFGNWMFLICKDLAGQSPSHKNALKGQV